MPALRTRRIWSFFLLVNIRGTYELFFAFCFSVRDKMPRRRGRAKRHGNPLLPRRSEPPAEEGAGAEEQAGGGDNVRVIKVGTDGVEVGEWADVPGTQDFRAWFAAASQGTFPHGSEVPIFLTMFDREVRVALPLPADGRVYGAKTDLCQCAEQCGAVSAEEDSEGDIVLLPPPPPPPPAT
jgi:hypothetical protein